jgi:hypothetical protein
MERLTMKTSTVIISLGEQFLRYRSLSEVPAKLRKQVTEATSGANSATIIIADEAGRQEIARSIAGDKRKAASLLRHSRGQKGQGGGWVPSLRVRQWLELTLLAGIGACLFLLARWQ